MYTKISVLNRVLENADRFVKDNDRDLYAPYFRAVEEYISARGFYLGGDAGNNLLIHAGEQNFRFGREVVSYEIHCTDAGRHMQALADIMYQVHNPNISRDTIFGETVVRGLEYKISINTRDVILIHAFRLTNSLEEMTRIVPPVEREGPYSKRTIRCIPGTPHLLAITRRLYTPYSPDYKHTYSEYLEMTKNIWKNVDAEFDRILSNGHRLVKGGDVSRPHSPTNEYLLTGYLGGCCDGGGEIDGGQAPLKDEKIVNTFLKRKLGGLKNTILIGDYALSHLPDKTLASYRPAKWRLQVISDNSTAELIEIFKSIDPSLTYGYNKFPSVDTSDFQTTKFAIYFENSNGKKIHLCDVFNNASFELVPFKEYHGIKVGGPFVLLRFKLSDIWTLTLIRDPNLHARIVDNIRQSRLLLNYAYTMVNNNPSDVFQLKDYIGVYIDRSVGLKRILGKSRFNIPRYYPGSRQSPDVAIEEPPSDEDAAKDKKSVETPLPPVEGGDDTVELIYEIPELRHSSVSLSSSRSPQYHTSRKSNSAVPRSRSVPYDISPKEGMTIGLDAGEGASQCQVVAGRSTLCDLVCGRGSEYPVNVLDGVLYVGEPRAEVDPTYAAVAQSLGIAQICPTTFVLDGIKVATDGPCASTGIVTGTDVEWNWLYSVLGGATNVVEATVTATSVIGLEYISLDKLVPRFTTTTPVYMLFVLMSMLKWLMKHVTGPGKVRAGPNHTIILIVSNTNSQNQTNQ